MSLKPVIQQQQNLSTCGQTCVAMAAHITWEEACKAVGKKSGTHGTHLIKALVQLGMPCAVKSKLIKRNEDLPEKAILRLQSLPGQSHKAFSGGVWRGHWVLKWHNEIFEPFDGKVWILNDYQEFIKSRDWQFTSFIQLN